MGRYKGSFNKKYKVNKDKQQREYYENKKKMKELYKNIKEVEENKLVEDVFILGGKL